MNFKEVITRALEVRAQYANLEKDRYGREWTREEIMLGFMQDVGDLSRLVQSKEGVRFTEDLDEKLGHELSDCLWSIIVLANKYDVDLEVAFTKTMNELGKDLSGSS